MRSDGQLGWAGGEGQLVEDVGDDLAQDSVEVGAELRVQSPWSRVLISFRDLTE